jgi:hypothetical protein
MTGGDEDTWAEIRHCYEETPEAQDRIAATFGVSRSTIRDRALREGWRRYVKGRKPVSRPVSTHNTAMTAEPEPIRPFVSRPPDAPDVRISRIYRVIDLQLDSLEKDMSSGDPVSAQDHERRARAMHLIIESLDQAKEAAAELLKREQHAAGSTCAETERVRNDIAARVERMGTRWDTETKS